VLDALRPDILLTDVRMNRMNGLTLAQKSRELYPDMEVVFISGYADAEYLRDALRVRAYDYLYKPVRMDELRELMRRLTDKLAAKARIRQEMERARILLEKSRPVLVERFMRSWIGGMLADRAAVQARMDLLELSIPENCGLLAAVFQPEWPTFPSDRQAESYLLLLEGVAREHLRGVLTCAEETGIVALVPLPDAEDVPLLDTAFQAISDHMRGITDAALRIGVSDWHRDWAEVPEIVLEAQQTLERHPFHGEYALLRYSAAESPAEPDAVLFDEGLEDMVVRCLLTGNADRLRGSIQAMLAGADADAEHAESVRKRLMRCALQADLTMERMKLPGIDALSFCRRALSHRSIVPMAGTLTTALLDACQRAACRQAAAYSGAIDQTFRIIQTGFADRLSVEMIAEHVHYSPAHLSALFRQETGMTIGDALFRARMDEAVSRLRGTRESVAAVAKKSGYTDVQYFSRVFKRFTGMTPLEYRKKAAPC
jgi:two-component system response regulator YesN